MSNEELWQAALGEIELSISKANFITWFKNTSIVSNENGRVIISVPHGFAKEWLENKYNIYILRALRNLEKDIKEIACLINPDAKKKETIPNTLMTDSPSIDAIKAPKETAPSKASSASAFNNNSKIDTSISSTPFVKVKPVFEHQSNLNPRYTFDKFIIGEHNELAKAACVNVANEPGEIYNPLFIYGGVGLGKTHLMQSVGNAITKNNSNIKVRYVTAERFTNELVASIKNYTIDDFKNYYQSVDVFIIDDIQFISGKEKTQNEFFHIFNFLYQINKQLVISSDKPPKSIPTLEDRLRSRFEGGMMADISRPDLETRVAILRNKAHEKNIFLEEDVLQFIAENIVNNIRELEGALNRILAHCQIKNELATIENVKNILNELILHKKQKNNIQYDQVLKAVTDFYNINQKRMLGKGRKKEIVYPRQVAMYIIRQELQTSYPNIGDYFGGRDHTTVLHACEKIGKEISNNKKLREEIELIKEKIYNT